MSNIQNCNWVASTNPLHADNGVSVVQQIRGEQAKVEFRPTLAGQALRYSTVEKTKKVTERGNKGHGSWITCPLLYSRWK